jgi:hypothetical protein
MAGEFSGHREAEVGDYGDADDQDGGEAPGGAPSRGPDRDEDADRWQQGAGDHRLGQQHSCGPASLIRRRSEKAPGAEGRCQQQERRPQYPYE